MEDEAWVDLDWDTGKLLWAEFADRYQFRASTSLDEWPAIVEPSPSVVWDLGSGRHRRVRAGSRRSP